MPRSRLHYFPRQDAICGRHRPGIFNRPLYLANTHAFVLAGDRLALRFASGDTLHGTLVLGLMRQGRIHWLHDVTATETEFRPARFLWRVRPAALPGVTISFEVAAPARLVGMAARLRITGAQPGDELVWACGGARTYPKRFLNWDLDPHIQPTPPPAPIDPALCQDNLVRPEPRGGRIAPGRAARFSACLQWTTTTAPQRVAAEPLLRGEWRPARASAPALLAARVRLNGDDFAATCSWVRVSARQQHHAAAPERLFTAGLARSAALAGRIQIDTPDPHLNALAPALAAAIDGTWYPPIFRHGGMLWNVPLPGWRTLFGATAAGWHERVRAQAAFYISHQEKSRRHRSLRADAEHMLTIPARDSRFHGRGRITKHQGLYNMQSQFFDQLIHAWRWTGDAKLARLLRPALELHLEWLRDCFDPDHDGLYESVINVWPSDSVWYAGGGAAEETSYAFRAHTAARDLALLVGDRAAARRHRRRLALIRRAFRRKLWIRSRGHPGLYREPGPRGRLHEDAWLYSIFLPVDAGLLGELETAQALRYTERALQNDPAPAGGRRVWTSNFVPGIWSVRENWPGDNYHLALAYGRNGRPGDLWDILRGNFLHTAYSGDIPGDFGAPAGGTDFSECSSTLARTLVEGLFGLAPDYPGGVVKIAPKFPETWDHARLQTPDASLRFMRQPGELRLDITLARPAKLDLRLNLCAQAIKAVTAGGRKVRWRVTPGFGQTTVLLSLPATCSTVVTVTFTGGAPAFAPVERAVSTGQSIVLTPANAVLLACHDPQSTLAQPRLRSGRLEGRVTGQPGDHTVFARARFGALPQWRQFHLHVRPRPPARPLILRRIPARARWTCLDLPRNGDIRAIFQQKYLSPRPSTMSARIGTDGYSPWTFPYWKCPLPDIQLDRVPSLLAAGTEPRLLTPQGVPFAWTDGPRNAALTSRWDNWPARVRVPVQRRGAAAWFLVCGSTNPMQCRIANAVLRLLYADGVEERLELVPPFNYWNLCPVPVGGMAPGQTSRADYTAPVDAFCLPAVHPPTVQLGQNCRAMLLHQTLRPGKILAHVELETLSAEVVVGLMGVTLMDR